MARDRERLLKIAEYAFRRQKAGLHLPLGLTLKDLINCLEREDPKIIEPVSSDPDHYSPLTRLRKTVESKPLLRTLIKSCMAANEQLGEYSLSEAEMKTSTMSIS